MNRDWVATNEIGFDVRVGGRLILGVETYGYALGAFDGLRKYPLAELIEMVQEQKPRGTKDDFPQWPTYVTIDDTSLEYFEKMFDTQTVRPRRGIELIVTKGGLLFVGVEVIRRSNDLSWPEMQALLSEWCAVKGCELDLLQPYQDGIPHVWTAHAQFPYLDRTVESACQFAEDMIGLVRATETGSFDREVLGAVLRSGQAELLVGCREGQALEVKRPITGYGDEEAKLELAKDIASFANTSTGGIIVVGAITARVNSNDVIQKVSALQSPGRIMQQINSIVRSHIYPPIEGLSVEEICASRDGGGNVIMIDIPGQSADVLPVLAHGIKLGNKRRDIFIAAPYRTDADTAFMPISAIHSRLVAGNSRRAWRTPGAATTNT